MPSVHSKPKANPEGKEEVPDDVPPAVPIRSSLTDLLDEAKAIREVGALLNVPFKNLVVGGMAIDGGSRQRGIHDNSISGKSVRDSGWKYDKGPLKVYEMGWSAEEWAAEIASGRIPECTEIPTLLSLQTWELPEGSSIAQINPPDMEHRRFFVEDGNHRTHEMHKMIEEKHPNAIDTCLRNIILMDADYIKDKNKSVISSMLANNSLRKIDKDFLADKLGQIKLVWYRCDRCFY